MFEIRKLAEAIAKIPEDAIKKNRYEAIISRFVVNFLRTKFSEDILLSEAISVLEKAIEVAEAEAESDDSKNDGYS